MDLPPENLVDPEFLRLFRRDEWFENREVALGAERNRAGQRLREMEGRLRRPLGWLFPARARREWAQTLLELQELLGRLAEVREVRRGLLGKAHNAHIRPRETPTFVREQPDYGRPLSPP